jgi:hypothetical protein
MARELKPLVKTSELKTNYIEKLAKQGSHPLYLNYNKVLDTLVLLFISPENKTLVHYVDECVALVITPDTLDIVGVQIEDFKQVFLPKYNSVQKAWKLSENLPTATEDFWDLAIYVEKRKQKVAHEIFEATEAILGEPARQLKDVLEFA